MNPTLVSHNPNHPVHIVIVSNRGPFSFSMQDGSVAAERGAGGLVTAISAVARQHDILWISCALSKGDRDWIAHTGGGVQSVEEMRIRLFDPAPEQYQAYYNVISNPLLWFVQHQLHDTPRQPILDAKVWHAWENGYRVVNRQLAEVTAETIRSLDGTIIVMPQDYHLYLFPQYLRELLAGDPANERVTIQSFLHIPFPGADAWRVLPQAMRRELLEGMLHADRLGFQTERDTHRFLQTVVDNLPRVRVVRPWRALEIDRRIVHAAPHPISIDAAALEARLQSPDVQTYVRQIRNRHQGRKLLLRIDRVEPSKNVLRGFIAFRNLLQAYPEYQGQIDMLALLVPSRGEVREYKTYLRHLMALAGEINATLGSSEWEPIRVVLGNNYDRALAALSLYDVLLVNPLADGMNLVAKEGAVLNRRDGVLILSEEAGAAEEFGDLPLLVSPYDVYGTREAIRQALHMPADERQRRAGALAEQVRAHDIHRWFARQLEQSLQTLER
ncbi:MAG: trehalose-6-phosphate synthase [bacterium]|nr:trehalose-6-phosphate synthase [bacterium]